MNDLDQPIVLAACTLISLCAIHPAAREIEDVAARAHLAVDEAVATAILKAEEAL